MDLEAVGVVVVDIAEMMEVAIAVEILAMDLAMRETIRMETERGGPDHHVATGVDQDVILSVVQTKSIAKETIAGTTDEAVNVAMTDRMSSEMGMTETVHPGDNDHDDSDLVYQERIVHLRMEKAAKVAINTMMVAT